MWCSQQRGLTQCGIVTFTVEGRESAVIERALKEQHINVTESPRDATLLDLSARGLASVVRASVHYYSSEEEIERFVQAIGILL